MSLDLLRVAQSLAARSPEPGLPANRLRLTLEYPEPPDPDAERRRIAELLGGEGFALEPLDPLLPRFLVLQFPGIERRMSPESLFAAADALVDALGLVSAVPDIGATFIIAPEDPDRVEGVADLFLGITCWSKEKTLPPDWSVDAIRAPRVWARGITGAGIVVAQPDSGVAAHGELDGALDLAKAANTLDGSTDPTDPLSAEMKNPGHGTATASVVASRAAGQVHGAAPGAKVVPIRCLNSVVLGLDPTPVARAILHAVRIRADVISMSLGGGLYSPAMAAALQAAADAGIVIVSAAGNCVQPIVVYPARDRNSVAMAGSNLDSAPWKGTSRGTAVDLAAPAENVLVARRSPDDGGAHRVKPSQGTSFATALTAGVAALWLQHHGRDRVRAEAARLGITVTHLFRTAARHTARRPDGWPRGMGAGIVDAEALIDLDLSRLRSPGTPETPEPPADDALVAALDEAFDAIETGMDDWSRIGPETVFLLHDAWLRAERSAGVPVETPTRPRPSGGTAARMPGRMRTTLEASVSEAVVQHPVITGKAPQRSDARLIAAGAPGTAESSATLTEAQAIERLKGEQAARVVRRAEAVFSALGPASGDTRNARAEVVQRADAAIRAVIEGKTGDLDLSDRVALEALVQLTDRPAYRVTDGSIDPDDPLFGEWGGFLALIVDLPRWTRAVGRIDIGGIHAGTGFHIGGGLIMTNRHVLEACADEVLGPGGAVWRLDRGAVTIDFSDAGDGSQTHDVASVVMAGPTPIHGMENLANLDAAILRLTTPPKYLPGGVSGGVPFARSVDATADMAIVGYPARPGTSAFIDPATGRPSVEIGRRLREIFGTDYGRKYVAPGRVLAAPGTLPGDPHAWALAHDCTTLGGNSGSLLVQFTGTPAVAGLHFSGAPLAANKAHALGRVDAHALGPLPGATWV